MISTLQHGIVMFVSEYIDMGKDGIDDILISVEI